MAAKRVCSVEGCGKPVLALNLCNRHYLRLRRHGDPLAGDRLRGEFHPCSVDGCNRPIVSRGWCDGHYSRWKKYKDIQAHKPLRVQKLPPPHGEALKFLYEVAVPAITDDCIIYPYGIGGGGYGAIDIDGRKRPVHLVVCEIVHGPAPAKGYQAAHNCGVRACCNPRHVRWATPAENMADKLIHGTHNRGTRHSLAKVSEEDVREIRALKGILSAEKVGKKFGLSRSTVYEIFNHKIWKWLDNEG